MLSWLLIIGTILALCFGLVLLVGAPYLPTLGPQARRAILLAAEVKKDPLLYELGSGDGKLMVAAAKAGIQIRGYELNPLVWLIGWLRCVRFGRLVEARLGNFWKVDLGPADVIFVFLHPRFMARLDKKITRESERGVTLISFAFAVPGRQEDQKIDGLFVYRYPAAKKVAQRV